jgi:flagellar biosynthesis protein FlhG
MRTLAITSGKGGVGKTNLTANLCIALAQTGKRVVAFDGDLGLANLDIVLGITAEFTLQHVVAEQKTLSEVVVEGPGGIGFVAGGSAIHTLLHAGPKRMGTFIAQMQQLAGTTDYLVIDTSSGIDSKVLTFLSLADEVLLVATPEPSSITDAYAVAKVLFKKRPNAPVKVLVNMVQFPDEAKCVYGAIQTVAQQFLDKELSYLGHVRADVGVSQATRTRAPFLLSAPNGPASVDVRMLASHLAASHRAEAGGIAARLLDGLEEEQTAA